MATASATIWMTPQATPGIEANSIAFTSGSTIKIDAPAERVFGIILDYKSYSKWNTFSPKSEFEEGCSIDVGAKGNLTARMENQNREYVVPITITEFSKSDARMLAWRASLMPTCFAVAERVQTVTPSGPGSCEIKQWETMSGWGAYALDWFLGVWKQLGESNAKYVEDLKRSAEI